MFKPKEMIREILEEQLAGTVRKHEMTNRKLDTMECVDNNFRAVRTELSRVSEKKRNIENCIAWLKWQK